MANPLHKPKRQALSECDSTPIPDKLYFNIGEVAKLCDVKPHVLRYWEEEFSSLSPVKRRGNRRYYQRKDVLLVRQIKDLLYVQGFTIEGAKAQLVAVTHTEKEVVVDTSVEALQKLLHDLENILVELET